MSEETNLLQFRRSEGEYADAEAATEAIAGAETDAEADARELRERMEFTAVIRRWEAEGHRRRLYEICRYTEREGPPVQLSDDDLSDLLWLVAESHSGRSFRLEYWELKWVGIEIERALRAGRLMGGGKRGPHKYETAYEEIGRLCQIYWVFYDYREREDYYPSAEATAEFMTARGFKMEASTVRDRITECNSLLGPSCRWGRIEDRVERLAKKMLELENEKKWKRAPGLAIPPVPSKPPV